MGVLRGMEKKLIRRGRERKEEIEKMEEVQDN
jgi:hypothetical protein